MSPFTLRNWDRQRACFPVTLIPYDLLVAHRMIIPQLGVLLAQNAHNHAQFLSQEAFEASPEPEAKTFEVQG